MACNTVLSYVLYSMCVKHILLFVLFRPGYGLVCHRAMKTTAELMGIKDLHCKVEGSTGNVQAIIRAFFDALIHQVWTFKVLCIYFLELVL